MQLKGSFVFVMITDDTFMHLVNVGDAIIIPHLSLSNVYPIPNLTLNLVFISQLCELKVAWKI